MKPYLKKKRQQERDRVEVYKIQGGKLKQITDKTNNFFRQHILINLWKSL